MAHRRIPFCFLLLLVLVFCEGFLSVTAKNEYVSAVGDSGMRRDNLRLAIESWNQCNEVGEEPLTGSPRAADCFDIYQASPQPEGMFNTLHIYLYLINRRLCKINSSAKVTGCKHPPSILNGVGSIIPPMKMLILA